MKSPRGFLAAVVFLLALPIYLKTSLRWHVMMFMYV